MSKDSKKNFSKNNNDEKKKTEFSVEDSNENKTQQSENKTAKEEVKNIPNQYKKDIEKLKSEYEKYQTIIQKKVSEIQEENKKLKEEKEELVDRQSKMQIAIANEKRHMEFKLKSQQNQKLHSFIEQLITKIHNFDIAIGISGENKNIQAGIVMIKKQFLSLLNQYGIYEITSQIGDKFDSNIHEAIESIEGNQDNKGTVSRIISNGFIRNDNNTSHLNDNSVVLKTIQVEIFA